MAIACTFYIVSLNVGCKLAVICSRKFIITVLARDVVFQLFFPVANVWFLIRVTGA